MLTPVAERVAARDLRSTVRVDGFRAPTGDRRKDTYSSGMYSGMRYRCGFNIQVVGSFHGRLVLTGKPRPGAMHDAKACQRRARHRALEELAASIRGLANPLADMSRRSRYLDRLCRPC